MAQNVPHRPQRGPDSAGLVVAVLLLALAGLIGYDLSRIDRSTPYGLGPEAMPGLVAIGLVLLAIGNAALAFRERAAPRESVDLKAIFLILGGLAALIACIALDLGFIPGTAILFAATATAFGRRAYLADLAIGLGLGIVIYLLFAKLLTLSLPMGPIERLF